MSKISFSVALLCIGFVFAIFAPIESSTAAGYFGEAIGITLGMLAIGVVLGVVLWLPAKVIKGPDRVPDFKPFVLVGAIISAVLLLVGQLGAP